MIIKKIKNSGISNIICLPQIFVFIVSYVIDLLSNIWLKYSLIYSNLFIFFNFLIFHKKIFLIAQNVKILDKSLMDFKKLK